MRRRGFLSGLFGGGLVGGVFGAGASAHASDRSLAEAPRRRLVWQEDRFEVSEHKSEALEYTTSSPVVNNSLIVRLNGVVLEPDRAPEDGDYVASGGRDERATVALREGFWRRRDRVILRYQTWEEDR